jgi:hypothetical protein
MGSPSLIFIYRVFLVIHQEKLSKLAFIIVTEKRFHPFTITFFETTVPSDHEVFYMMFQNDVAEFVPSADDYVR